MNWQTIVGPLVQAGLPLVGGMVLGPLGSQAGGLVGKLIAELLGVEPTPEAVVQAVTTQPELARSRLAEMESAQRAEIDRLRIEAENTANARAMQTVAVQSGSWTATVPVVVTALNYLIAAGVITGVGMGWLREDGIITGFALGAASTAFNFWLGSSSGSKNKTETISGIAVQSNAPSPAQLVGRVVNDAIADKHR